ncbi:MAG TPA: enoyl-CoA hydratase-related protein [Acidimicrobiia bacterium]|nr:enoyl-CoA hydratase-related protein [Acidimicrobiia bacterium]
MTTKYELDGDVAVLTLNRPERYNAIDAELSASLVAALARAGEEARAVVLTGEGKAFCSGADLSGFAEEYEWEGPDLARHLDEEFHPMVHAIGGCRVPVLAAVNGVAAGAGMGLALGCDIRVMAESAYFTSAFTAIGLVPDSGSTWLLPHHLGTSLALEMTLTNRRMPAAEAHQRGLCAEVTADGEVVNKALEYAARLADLPTDALVTTRQLILGSSTLTFPEGLEAEKREQGRLGKTPEHHEGVDAFLEKRKPDFRNPA